MSDFSDMGMVLGGFATAILSLVAMMFAVPHISRHMSTRRVFSDGPNRQEASRQLAFLALLMCILVVICLTGFIAAIKGSMLVLKV
jgi:hypothetical protein